MINTYRIEDGNKLVKGIGLPAFIHNGTYFNTIIKVYEDGMIDCWELVDFEEFTKKVQDGWIVTEVPEGERISRHHSFDGIATGFEFFVTKEDFILEVKGTINRLQGKDTSSARTYKAFTAFLKEPSEEHRVLVEEEYSKVPKHLRVYILGDMDYKDYPIISVINCKGLAQHRIDTFKERYLPHN